MSRHKRRAKTAKTVAFPALSGAGTCDFQLQDALFNTSSLTDYPFLQRTIFNSNEKNMRFTTLSSNRLDPRNKPNAQSHMTMTKSTSNLFSFPPPPPLNPKLKFLKTLMNSKTTSSATKVKAGVKSVVDSSNVREQITPSTPALPPKLRTNKTKTFDAIGVTRPSEKKSILLAPLKFNAESGPPVSDNIVEPLLPSLQSSPAPGSQNIKDAKSDEHAILTGKQMYRTEEERLENPESIHLDKKSLKHFPFLGSEEMNLKLVSLQHNFICRLENLPSLNHLLVLDLYDNRVERITGLQVFHSLRVLLLGKNRIRRIEGLDGLKRLEILDLHGNQLRYIDNLTSLTSLRVLNLAGNLIRSIRNLGPYGLSALTELNLKRNRIKNLDGLHKAPHIRKLLLANNELQSVSALYPLRKMLFLQELLLESNPVCSLPDYVSQILTIFPWLTTLDKTLITDQMKLNAKIWHRRRIVQDEEKRKEQEKLRLTAASTREEIIHEARRRWESVKKFVKHSNAGEDQDQDEQLTQSVNLTRSAKIDRELRRTKSATGFNEEILSPLRFSISTTVPKTDKNPLQLVNSTTNYIRREESVVTSLTKGISLKPRDVENASRSPASSLRGNTHIDSQYTEVLEISNHSSICDPIRPKEIQDNYIVEPTLLRKLMKVAVVRPLQRITHPELPVVQTLDGSCAVTGGVQATLAGNLQSSEAPNSPGEILESQIPVEPTIAETNTTISAEPNDESSPDYSNTSDIEILTVEQSARVQEPTVDELGIDLPNPEIIDFKNGIEIIVPDTSNMSKSTPTLAKRPVFGRSASTCILSAIPTALTTTNNSSGSSSVTSSNMNISGIKPNEVESMEKYLLGTTSRRQASVKNKLSSVRSSSVDVVLATSDSDTFDLESPATSTNPTSEVSTRRAPAKSLFPRKGRLRRGQTARALSTTSALVSLRRPVTGIRERRIGSSPLGSGRSLKRRDSVVAIENPISNVVKKQGSDYLVEIDGKVLSLYGQGALKHMITGSAVNLTSIVNTVKFHFISFDTIIPHFGKLRQAYPALEHVQFRANNISVLAQLNALADLQGLSSLQISKEGNPILDNDIWQHYAIYRLAHWGLQQINGKEIPSEYRGGNVAEDCKVFESLGYLALSCLPQSALTPLAKKLHTLHCFCCCSTSSSSDESGRKKTESSGDGDSGGNICTSWDDDPVLLDVIGKESLVYIPSKEENDKTKDLTREVGTRIVTTGRDMIEKLDLLESTWSSLMSEVVEDILIDYLCMDNYMKKELRKLRDSSLLTTNSKKSKF